MTALICHGGSDGLMHDYFKMKPYDDYSPEIEYNTELPPASELTREQPAGKENSKGVSASARKGSDSKRKSGNKMRKSSESSVVSAVKQWANLQTVRWISGLFLGFTAVYLCVSFLSYLTDCIKDQSVVNSMPFGEAAPIVNRGGEGGARISEFLINESFGLGSFVIIFWMCAMSLKLLVGRPRFKSVDFTIKSVVAVITVSLIVGLLTIGFESPVNWGGYHGRYVNEFVIHFFGWIGGVILCLFMLSTFVVICLRDLINWIIRMRKAYLSKKAARDEQERLRREREMEIEEMRRFEKDDARKAGEDASPELEPAAEPLVSFEGNDGYYSSLPDIEEYDMESDGVDSYIIKDDVAPASVPAVVDTSNGDSREDAHPATGQKVEDIAEKDDDINMVVNVNEIAQNDSDSPMRGYDSGTGFIPYKMPPVDLLRAGKERVEVDAEEQMANKELIRNTLLEFKIPIVSIEATIGPTVTLYEIVPEPGVKINGIRKLVDDIALRIRATGVRIIAPIPGKGTVGIEVANKDPQTVSMRTIINSRKFHECGYKLPMALGSTISNDVYIADLAKMPHLLVAGATGQGKSVGLNAIITSLLYSKKPDELKFVMVDPKMVEFSLYAKIEKHYLAKLPGEEEPIITDMAKVVPTLTSLCVEMDDRYTLLKSAGVRNIEEYNPRVLGHRLNPSEGHRFLPYIVVIVDEFSDLIMTSGKEVEMPIARLAQKARAVGIHVIIATQRPSTNVITGLIKANFPARIAFKVSSGIDSKTILDTPGAQQLIGRGDMLISYNSVMVRVQCAFIDTPEVEDICTYISQQPFAQGAYMLPDPPASGSGDDGFEGSGISNERDPLFEEVARRVVNSNTASTSSLQRLYSIGYNRAGKIMDQLERAGIVGPSHGGKPRDVLVDPMTLESMLN